MEEIRRAPIDEFIGDVNPDLAGAVRASTALRTVATALDQVVNRSNDDIRRWGKIDDATLLSFEGDFDHVRKQLDTLEASAKTGRSMLAAIESQTGVAAPKTAKGKK